MLRGLEGKLSNDVMPRAGRWFWLLLVLLLVPEAALLGFFTVGVLLSAPASLPHYADVVVVLGGSGDGARYARGVELLKGGFSQRLVLIEPTVAERKDALQNLPGVEIWDDIFPGNSWGEAQATRARMQAKGWRTVLVVSDPPHMLRVRYSWASQFRGSDLSYTLVASNPPWWSAWRWWANTSASDFVGNEVLKLGYYVVRYRFGFF